MGKVWVVQLKGKHCQHAKKFVYAETKWHAIELAMFKEGMHKISKNRNDYKVK